ERRLLRRQRGGEPARPFRVLQAPRRHRRRRRATPRTRPVRIAAIQHDIVWEDRDANFDHLDGLIADAASRARLVVLTEMFSTGFSMDTGRVAEPFDGPSAQF